MSTYAVAMSCADVYQWGERTNLKEAGPSERCAHFEYLHHCALKVARDWRARLNPIVNRTYHVTHVQYEQNMLLRTEARIWRACECAVCIHDAEHRESEHVCMAAAVISSLDKPSSEREVQVTVAVNLPIRTV